MEWTNKWLQLNLTNKKCNAVQIGYKREIIFVVLNIFIKSSVRKLLKIKKTNKN
jgi:hypothetical protein